MTDASHSRQPSIKIDEDGYNREEHEQDTDGRGNRLVLPEDGYEWKKYGQKFIKNIGKVRSYFKCQRSNCCAKKRVDWSTSEPGSVRVVYDGIHTHIDQSSQSHHHSTTTSAAANQSYDLLTQVFGDRSLASHHHQHH